MFFSKLFKRDTKCNCKSSEIALNALKANIAKLESELNAYKRTQFSLSVAIDFSAINAFSIERLPLSRYEPESKYGIEFATVIGHVLDGKSMEWILFCSDSDHERLVAEFKGYVGKKHGS